MKENQRSLVIFHDFGALQVITFNSCTLNGNSKILVNFWCNSIFKLYFLDIGSEKVYFLSLFPMLST